MASHMKKSRFGQQEENDGNSADEEHVPEEMDENQGGLSSDDDSDDEEMETFDEKIDVEFEARNLEEMDFHGIKQLLLQLFLRTNLDVSSLADLLIKQNFVGSVIKQYFDDAMMDDDDEEDVDVNQNTNLKEQLKDHLIKKLSAEKQSAEKLSSFLDNPAHRIGLILNERFVNIPAQIAVPSFAALSQEMDSANKKGYDFNLTHFLMVAKKFRMKLSQGGKKRRSKKPMEQEIYSNGEEEFFSEAAEFRATYSVVSERDTGVVQQWDSEMEEQYEPLREVVVFRADKLPQIMETVKKALEQAATTAAANS